MTFNRERKEAIIRLIIVSLITILVSVGVFLKNSIKSEDKHAIEMFQKKEEIKNISQQKVNLLKKEVAVDSSLAKSREGGIDINVVTSNIKALLNEIKFAKCSLKSINYHKKYNNLLYIEIEAKSPGDDLPNKIMALALIEIFKLKEFKNLFNPLDGFKSKGGIISFIYKSSK